MDVGKMPPFQDRDHFDDDDDDEDEDVEQSSNKPVIKLHRVNCVSAMLFCYSCCQNVIDANGQCKITAESWTSECEGGLCKLEEKGERRMKTWISGVDGCIDALSSFFRWLIDGLPGGRKRSHATYVLGHYCGRYFPYDPH